MNRFTQSAIALIAVCLTFVSAQAAEEDQKNYVDILAAAAQFDRDKLVDDGFAGGSMRLGRAFSERWNLELAATALDVKGNSSKGGVDMDEFTLGANALAVWNRGGGFQPFILVGLGGANTKFAGGNGRRNAYANYGVGAFAPIFNNKARLRIEAVGRALDDSIDSRDWFLNAGFSIPFGKRPAPVVLAAAPVVVDTDGDGVADGLDQCPNTPAGARVDEVGCELDSDGDGVVDSKDECPNTPAGTRVDEVGCPIVVVINLEGVKFRTNSADLLDGAETLLAAQAATLIANKDITIEVAGHTDSDGEASYNEGLSQLRADTVRRFLISEGVEMNRITARGYGESEPVASNDTRDGKAQNRRVELRIRDK